MNINLVIIIIILKTIPTISNYLIKQDDYFDLEFKILHTSSKGLRINFWETHETNKHKFLRAPIKLFPLRNMLNYSISNSDFSTINVDPLTVPFS